MESNSKNNLITFIGAILVALLFFILSLFDKKLIINPYSVSISVAIILSMFIYFAIKSSSDTRSELAGQEIVLEELKEEFALFQKRLEEKFKIHNRLNKLEVKVFNG